VAGLFRVRNRRGGVYDWASNDWSRDILRAAGTPVIAEGLEHIPRDQPVMYASNHSSMFDIWALFATLPGSVRFVAKQELFKIPLLGGAMRAVGHIPIDRAAARKRSRRTMSGTNDREGTSSIVVFPEGRAAGPAAAAIQERAVWSRDCAQFPSSRVRASHVRDFAEGRVATPPRPIRLLAAADHDDRMRPDDRERLRDQVRAAMVALQSKAR